MLSGKLGAIASKVDLHSYMAERDGADLAFLFAIA